MSRNSDKLIWVFSQSHEHSMRKIDKFIEYNKHGTIDRVGNSFYMKNGSIIDFRNYNQDIYIMEGVRPDIILFDDPVPDEYLRMFPIHLTPNEGWMMPLI